MLYNELVQLGETQQNFTILACIPNSNYVAKWRDESNQDRYSKFPFFIFVQTELGRYFLPGISQIIANPAFAITNYIGYFSDAPDGAVVETDYSINPFA